MMLPRTVQSNPRLLELFKSYQTTEGMDFLKVMAGYIVENPMRFASPRARLWSLESWAAMVQKDAAAQCAWVDAPAKTLAWLGLIRSITLAMFYFALAACCQSVGALPIQLALNGSLVASIGQGISHWGLFLPDCSFISHAGLLTFGYAWGFGWTSLSRVYFFNVLFVADIRRNGTTKTNGFVQAAICWPHAWACHQEKSSCFTMHEKHWLDRAWHTGGIASGSGHGRDRTWHIIVIVLAKR